MKVFDAGKTRMIGLPYGDKTMTKPFSSDIGTLRTDRQTDRRADLLYQYRARDKNTDDE